MRDTAQSQALVATVSVSVGAAALLGAGVLWLTAPRANENVTSAVRPVRLALTSDGSSFGARLSGEL